MASAPGGMSDASQSMGGQLPTNLVSWINVQRCGYPKSLLQKGKHNTRLLKHTKVKVMITCGNMHENRHAGDSQGVLTHERDVRSKRIHDRHLRSSALPHFT